MLGREELSTDLLTELYDTYQDVKSGKLTLTRVYVLVIICGLSAFSILCVAMLFSMQFTIAAVYCVCALFCYVLLRFRRRRFIARYFDWIAVISSHFLTITSIVINVYLYGNAGGSQLFLFAMVAILYIITLDKAKKRFLITILMFSTDLIAFIVISYIDAHIQDVNNKHEIFYSTTFIVSSFLAMGICVAPVWISGLFSIEDIERLTALELKQASDYLKDEFYGCINRKNLDSIIAISDGELYNNLSICALEVVIGLKRNEVVHKVNDFYFSRVLKEFATLLKCYFTNAKFLIRWDTNTFLVIFESEYEKSYNILNSLMDSFEQKIRRENDTLEVYLRISAKNFKTLDTRKRPRLLLDCINELLRIKHDNAILGREFLQMNTDMIDSSKYRGE